MTYLLPFVSKTYETNSAHYGAGVSGNVRNFNCGSRREDDGGERGAVAAVVN